MVAKYETAVPELESEYGVLCPKPRRRLGLRFSAGIRDPVPGQKRAVAQPAQPH